MNKVVSLSEAAGLIKDGEMVAFGGMTLYRRPMALVHEIIRQKIKDLQLLSFMGGIESDLLIAAGLVATVRVCYLGMEILGLAPYFRAAVEQGKIKVIEETNLTVCAGLRATLARMPAAFVDDLHETDILSVRKDLKYSSCPFTDKRLVAIPALQPDVAVIHVAWADEEGNAGFEGNLGIDLELSKAARKVILTTEKLLTRDEIVSSQLKAKILGFCVDRVVLTPYGAHPTSCYPYYTFDLPHLLSYLASSDPDSLQNYFDRYIYGAPSPEEYFKAVGGRAAAQRLSL